MRIAWSDDRRDCDGDLERVEVVARQIPGRSRQTTSGRSAGRNYVGAEKASILYSRQELAERLRLAWKDREENRANIDIFLAHGFAVEERCDSELSMSAPATPLPRKEPDFIRCPEKTLDWNIDAREKPSDSLGESRDDTLEDRGREIQCEVSNDELEAASGTTGDSMVRKNEGNAKAKNAKEEGEEKKYVVNSNVEEKRRTRISIDCTSLHSPNPTSFPSLKVESAVVSAKIASDDFSLAKQKRANFHSGTNRAFLVPMVEKSTKKSATDKIVPVRSSEIRYASASADKITIQTTTTDTRSSIVSDKNAVLVKSSSMISLEKTRRTNSAPPQRRGGENVVSAARVQVNIVIDAPSLAEATSDKPIADDQQGVKNTVEKSEEGSAKVGETVQTTICDHCIITTQIANIRHFDVKYQTCSYK